MKYDFSSIMDRHGMDAIAVDAPGTIPWGPKAPTREGFDLIPMWVADMNFPTVPTAWKGWHPNTSAMPTVFWAAWSAP